MLKTLREDGFKVTCYERRSQVGGLWAYTDDKSMTTALPSEHARCLRYVRKSWLRRSSYLGKHQQVHMRHVRLSNARQYGLSNLYFSAHFTHRYLEYPHYLSQADFQEYIESYATHFDMLKDIVFNASVKQVSRNKDDNKWQLLLDVDGQSRVEEYDKVAFCHGYQTQAKIPDFEGVEKFDGPIMHTQEFRM
jgi:dimethylaniline monooxygenase (N-oxide forming)